MGPKVKHIFYHQFFLHVLYMCFIQVTGLAIFEECSYMCKRYGGYKYYSNHDFQTYEETIESSMMGDG
jgi:hypothetical protein